MALDEKLVDVLRNHKEDVSKKNWVPVIVDAYLQGGARFVNELKYLITPDDSFKKFFNDAIERIVKDLLQCSDLLNPESEYFILNK